LLPCKKKGRRRKEKEKEEILVVISAIEACRVTAKAFLCDFILPIDYRKCKLHESLGISLGPKIRVLERDFGDFVILLKYLGSLQGFVIPIGYQA
jgi:hypothetical protein